MRKAALIILVIALSSCNQLMDNIIILGMTGYDEYYMPEWEELNSYNKITDYIVDHVDYTKDKLFSHTQSPEETMKRGKGDCEDTAVLFMNIAKVSMGIEMQAVVMHYRAIENGGLFVNHVAVRYDGIIVDPITCYKLTTPVMYYYEYTEVFP